MVHQGAELVWRDGHVPVSLRFDDPYYSIDDGLAESEFVFLGGNNLPHRLGDGFVIAELGVGTGLNLAATMKLWLRSKRSGCLQYVGFERYPPAPTDLLRALTHFPDVAPFAEFVLQAYSRSPAPAEAYGLSARIVIGDAAETVPDWEGTADAWFLDGFAPAKNPQLWTPDLMRAVGAHTRCDGSFATYTAAGSVRRALIEAGFDVERRPGFGRKRHMMVGRRNQ